MTHEVSTTTKNSFLPTIFRVSGEAHENASFPRIISGIALIAGGILVLVKLFTPKPPPSSSPTVTRDVEESESDEKTRRIAQSNAHKDKSSSPSLQERVEVLHITIDSSGKDKREYRPTTPFLSPTSLGVTFAENWESSLQKHRSPKNQSFDDAPTRD